MPVLGELLDLAPLNEGVLAPFRFRFPEGSLLRPPFPSATGLGARITGHAVAAAVTAALRAAGGRRTVLRSTDSSRRRPCSCRWGPPPRAG